MRDVAWIADGKAVIRGFVFDGVKSQVWSQYSFFKLGNHSRTITIEVMAQAGSKISQTSAAAKRHPVPILQLAK